LPRLSALGEARLLLARLDLLFLERRRNQAEIAYALDRARHLELHKACGYSSLSAMAWDRYQWGRSKTSESLAIVKACQSLPQIREVFRSGGLDWTKAREITKVATPHDEGEWLARAETCSAEELRAARRGEDPKVLRVLSFTPEQAARFDQALAGVRDGLELAEAGLAVLAVLEGGGGSLGESATTRVVISECGTCRIATTESREGSVLVERPAVASARCAGEVHDLREEENVVTRAIPAKVKRRVLDRDQRRCQVPRCGAQAFLEVHHEGGWRGGHDPKRMVVLCEAHHRQRHEGWLVIGGQAPEFTFRTRAGIEVGEVFSHENTLRSGDDLGGGSAPSPLESAPATRVAEAQNRAFAVADLALGRLGMGASERRRLLKRVVGGAGQRAWNEEELLRAALLAA
jgi:hypothetical protein